MKAEELRALDADELGGRLRGARRELYELRFKLAVGQQDNHREVRKARKEIARILTVVHQRRLEAVDEGDFEQRLAGSQPEGAEEAAETAGLASLVALVALVARSRSPRWSRSPRTAPRTPRPALDALA